MHLLAPQLLLLSYKAKPLAQQAKQTFSSSNRNSSSISSSSSSSSSSGCSCSDSSSSSSGLRLAAIDSVLVGSSLELVQQITSKGLSFI
ncbi:hypothetical protein Emag_005953 [Eimeria magna]